MFKAAQQSLDVIPDGLTLVHPQVPQEFRGNGEQRGLERKARAVREGTI